MNKTTDELNNELKEADDIRRFMKTNEDELISKRISDFLNELIEKKGLKKARVIDKANLQKTYAYEVLNGRKRNPSRDILLRLAFAMGLDLEETQTLLKHSRMPQLYARNSRDSIIIYAINNKKSLIDCNVLLDEMKEKPLE